MNVELVKLMDKEEVYGLAEAFQIDVGTMNYDAVCNAVAKKLRED